MGQISYQPHQPLTSAHSGEKSADACGKRAGHLFSCPEVVARSDHLFPAWAPLPAEPLFPQVPSLSPCHLSTPRRQHPGQSSAPHLPARQFWGLEGRQGSLEDPQRGPPMTLGLGPLCSPENLPVTQAALGNSVSKACCRLLVFAIVSRARRVVLADSQHLCVALQPYVGVLLARELVKIQPSA